MFHSNEEFCECYRVSHIKGMFGAFKDELREFAETPNKDEFSDLMFIIGRIIGIRLGMGFVQVPFSGSSFNKVRTRISETGCARSLNHKGCRREFCTIEERGMVL